MENGDIDASSAGPAGPDVDGAPEPLVDQALAAAVNDALIGDVLADLPEAQPSRHLRSATDFSSLYIRHRSGLAAHARRFLRDPRDVDEVVQETFLRLFLAISEIETELQAIAFARRTLTNLCIDRYRADRRRPTLITLDASPFFDVTSADEEPDPVLQAEDAAIVREALARLSPLHREALVKREIEEKALPQIAAELGIAEDSVKHLLFRARRALRRLLVGTSVEPGIDLAGDESGVPAQANPLIRGATVFILFLVGALVVATGIRPLLSGGDPSRPAAGPVGIGLPDLAGPGQDVPPSPTSAKTTHHPRAAHHGDSAGPVSPSSSVSAPKITLGQPKPAASHHPTRHAPVGGAASRGHFRLDGPLKVTGAPHVVQGGIAADDSGTTVAASAFSAVTDHGRFELNQTVSTSASGGTSVTVTPAFVVGGMVKQPNLTGTAASLGTDAQGNVTVDVAVGAQPDPSDNTFPLASLTAHLLLAPDLSQVLSETVTLATQPSDGSGPVTVSNGSPATTSPPTTPPSDSGGSSGPGTSVGAGSSGAGSPTTGTTASDPTTGTATTSDCPATGLTDPGQSTQAPTTTDTSACPAVAPESKVTVAPGLSARSIE